MAETLNYKLYITDDDQTKFKVWRENLAGETNSNMIKIDNALKSIELMIRDLQAQVISGEISAAIYANDDELVTDSGEVILATRKLDTADLLRQDIMEAVVNYHDSNK